MTRESRSIALYDFTGGLNTKSSVTSLAQNQARDLQNINILPNGGFEKRRGNTTFNSTAMDSGAAVHGLGYYRQAAGTDYLMAIAGTKIFKSDSLDGTMDDITGALTITTGADNIWTHVTMNNLSIFVGGNRSANVPIKWSGTGNAAVLGGTPPVGEFGVVANNRLFIGNTIANPSRMQWCTLGNPEDWTGTGSGNQDIGANDGDTLVGAIPVNVDNMLCFKQNYIYEMSIRVAPFPVFPLFPNVGAVSKRGIVAVDGIVYFITPEPRMKATDGTQIFEFPDTIDDVWDSLNSDRLVYLHGVHYRRLHQIWWFVSSSGQTTHDLALVWDLKRKCWLRHTTGYKMNTAVIARDRTAYAGAYDGKIYKQDTSGTYSDASEASSLIDAYWRSGWQSNGPTIEKKTIPYSFLSFTRQPSGSFTYSYGYDFNPDKTTETISLTSPSFILGSSVLGIGILGGDEDFFKLLLMKGQGHYFQSRIRNSNDGESFSFNGLEYPVQVQQSSH